MRSRASLRQPMQVQWFRLNKQGLHEKPHNKSDQRQKSQRTLAVRIKLNREDHGAEKAFSWSSLFVETFLYDNNFLFGLCDACFLRECTRCSILKKIKNQLRTREFIPEENER